MSNWIGGTALDAWRQDKLPVNSALHNLREIVKEFTLLEDHLFHPEKQCGSCIQKHLLKVEALFEEAVSMDETGEFATYTTGAADSIRALWAAANSGKMTSDEIGQIIRSARRELQHAIP
jgi:hypothetical protein